MVRKSLYSTRKVFNADFEVNNKQIVITSNSNPRLLVTYYRKDLQIKRTMSCFSKEATAQVTLTVVA